MYVIRSRWWLSEQESVRMYWAETHWTEDVAHAQVFHNPDVAKVYLDALVDPDHDDSGLPVKRGRKQDWTTRKGPDHIMRTNIELVEIT